MIKFSPLFMHRIESAAVNVCSMETDCEAATSGSGLGHFLATFLPSRHHKRRAGSPLRSTALLDRCPFPFWDIRRGRWERQTPSRSTHQLFSLPLRNIFIHVGAAAPISPYWSCAVPNLGRFNGLSLSLSPSPISSAQRMPNKARSIPYKVCCSTASGVTNSRSPSRIAGMMA